MKKNYISVIPLFLLFITCSDDSADQQKDLSEIDVPEYYGTYLYNDEDCSHSDIQYAISDLNGWEFKNNVIHKIFTFESYLNSIAFIKREHLKTSRNWLVSFNIFNT